jgi:alpha-2-macroglobulin
MTSRFATHVAFASLMLAACGGKKSDQPESIISEDVGSASELKQDEPPKLPPMTPKKLAPVIHELGAGRVVPTSIVIELAAPIVDRDSVGSSSPKSVLKIKPEISGTLTHSGPSQLTFTPNAPFEFDTTYEVDLQKVETRDGVIEAGGEKWTHSFKTPKFEFLGWAPNDVDLVHHKVTMQIEFSGAVLPNVARERSTISINGTPTNNVQVLPNRQPDKLVVLISDPQLVPGAKLSLAIKRDLPALANAKLNGVTAEYTVKSDKPVSIKTAQLVEGTTGYYLEVICNDAAATPGNRAFYENEGYYNLSQRCQLTEEALAGRIHFTPAVKKAYITSGRAGFRVFGDFKRGVYSVKIDAGAQTVDGGTVLAPFARSFAVTSRKPLLGFAASGRYLPRKAWANLGIKHTNMEAVNLIVRQVPPENLVFWLGNTGSDVADERTSNVVLRKTIPLRGDVDVASTTWLDVEQLLPTTSKGVLELKLVGVGATATSRLLLTNLSLVAKKTSPAGKPWLQTVQVWALDMESADALTGVEVSLVRKSGKVVAKCATAGKDGCTLDAKADSDPDQAEPFALIAKKGDDLTYLRYQDLRADVAESATAGQPYVATTPYRASVYSDRGVYRPGDTAHVVAIVRDAKDRAPDQALPIDVKVVDPRAKVVKKLTLKTNPAGQITFSHALPAFADTGHWRVQLAVADKALAGYDLQVEEFVPERMKVTATAKTPEASVGSKVAFDISAQYLFGGSAIDSGVTLTCSVEPERFSPDANSDLTYGVEPKGKPVSLGESRDQLDPRGLATVACPAPEATTQFTQTAKVEATVAVLEAGSGRATVRSASAMLHPEKFYIGAKTKATQAISGQTFTVEGLIVDWTGKPAAGGVQKLDAELIHLEADYGYGYDEDSGESSYERSLRTVPEGRQEVKVTDGKFKLDVTPAEAGAGYMVRLRAGKATTELVLDGSYGYDYYYEYGDSGRVDQTPRPAKPTQLSLKTPKEVKVGESATVKVLTPYRGKILWTVETDKVIKAEWKDASGGETSWDFKLPGFAPNVYVSAFLVKDPHLESKDAFMPDRAFGVSSIRVTPVEFTQAIKLDTPKEVRSSSKLSVKLDLGAAAADTFATVAVVDEGILSLTNFQTPDPLAQLFSRRSLGVETFETIGWTMLHQPAGNSSKTGGGDEGEAEADGGRDSGRVQPVKPVAMFSGLVKVGADGKVVVPFDIPAYRGKVRVMAISAGPSKIGRAEAEVLVRDPLVVQVTFPRFVTQNDEMQIPVFMTNVSGGPLDVSVELGGETLAIPGLTLKGPAVPPLAFGGKDRGSVRIEDGRAETLVFAVKANIPIGGAKLRVIAKVKGRAGSFEVKDEVEVPFLPAGPKERVIQKFKVDAGTIDLATKATVLKNWVPTSEHTTFWLTSNPYGESFDHLKYLMHYPYGCIEQTTSAARPLLYVGSLAEQVDPRLAELQIEDMVLSGINRIFSMQTPSGGFGYWPGATDPQEWGTAYATHFLLDAKKAGYSIPDDRLAEVITWIEQRAQQRERGVFQRAAFRYYDEQAESYLHYVLALAGKGKKARILALISQFPANAKGEQAEDVYMLKAALFLAGDRRFERDLKKVDTSPISAERVNSWSFYSDQRRRGLMLSTFFDLFKLDPAGELLAQRVAEGLTGHHSYYYNTQELVWGVTGLGKWVTAQQSRGTAAGTLVADGATIGPRKTKKASNDKTWTVARASEANQLTLEIPQSAAGMWLVVSSEGVRPGNAYKIGGNGMTLTRTYRSLDGTELDPAAGDLKLGDLVFVEIELANTSGAYIQNIALVDRLPGGFEVENPRLGRTTKVDWVKDEELWGMDFMNMRDDRLEAFGAMPPKTTRKVVYTVRAVTSGKFTIPPVEAEAMYDPTLWARAAAGTAVIGGPWTGKTL